MVCTADDGTTEQIGPDGIFPDQCKYKDHPECIDKNDVGPVQPGDYDTILPIRTVALIGSKEDYSKKHFCNMMRVGRYVLFFMKDIILMVGFTVNKITVRI